MMGKYQHFTLYYRVEEKVAHSENLYVWVTRLNYC